MRFDLRSGTARIIALVLVLAMAPALTGCGFHLRGSGALDKSIDKSTDSSIKDGFRTISVREPGPSASGSTWYAGARDDLRHEVTRAFTNSRFVVSSTAPITLDLLGENISRSVASIDASASAAEYQVNYELRFRITAGDGSTIVPETVLSAYRSYRYHDNAVMGSAEEEALLYQEMRRDIAAQIVRQYRRSIARHAPPAGASSAATDENAAPAHAPAP